MRTLVQLQMQLVPELLEKMVKRYRVLQYIRWTQPIGRRSLGMKMQMTERVVRGEVTSLKDQGLVTFEKAGMLLTDAGEALFTQLEDMMTELLGLRKLGDDLVHTLGVSRAIVVAGDSDTAEWIKQSLGRACANELKEVVKADDALAVMGGTTLAAVAHTMTKDDCFAGTTFVPARGSLGEKVEIQASTISAEFAQRTGAAYRLLHVPEHLSAEAHESLVLEPSVKDILQLITSAAIVMHGIGDATHMAERRGSAAAFIDELNSKQAVAEAFGYYFNAEGQVVYKQRTIGLQLDELQGKHVISIAGGHSKAEAILAYMNHRPSDVLITDEAAAKAILALVDKNEMHDE